MYFNPVEIWKKNLGALRQNLSIKFRVNPIHILRVINNFMCKTKPNFCHAYRLNRLEEQVENWHLARFNQRGAFWWLEMNQVGDCGDTKLNPTFVKSRNWFLRIIKRKSFSLYQTNRIKEWVKVCCEHGLSILKGLQQRKEEMDWRPVSSKRQLYT